MAEKITLIKRVGDVYHGTVNRHFFENGVRPILSKFGKHIPLVGFLFVSVGLISQAEAQDLPEVARSFAEWCGLTNIQEMLLTAGIQCDEGFRNFHWTMVEQVQNGNLNISGLSPDHPLKMVVDAINGDNTMSPSQAMSRAMEVMNTEHLGQNLDSGVVHTGDTYFLREDGAIVLTRASDGSQDIVYNPCDPTDVYEGPFDHTEKCEDCLPEEIQPPEQITQLSPAHLENTDVQTITYTTRKMELCGVNTCDGIGDLLTINIPVSTIPENILNSVTDLRSYLVEQASHVNLTGTDATSITLIDSDGNKTGEMLCLDDGKLYLFDTNDDTNGVLVGEEVRDIDIDRYLNGTLNEETARDREGYLINNNDTYQPYVPIRMVPYGLDSEGHVLLEIDRSVSLDELVRTNWDSVAELLGRYITPGSNEETVLNNIRINSDMLHASEPEIRRALQEAGINRDASYEIASWSAKLRDGVSESYKHQLNDFGVPMEEGERLITWIREAHREYVQRIHPWAE